MSGTDQTPAPADPGSAPPADAPAPAPASDAAAPAPAADAPAAPAVAAPTSDAPDPPYDRSQSVEDRLYDLEEALFEKLLPRLIAVVGEL